MAAEASRSRVVVVGGGFGGLETVKALAHADADVTLIDRHNYHLFQPLTYQVATGGLAPGEIATPLRHIFRRRKNVEVVLGEVTSIDPERRVVTLEQPADPDTPEIPYDTLVVSGGSEYSYFGHEEWRSVALEVKSLDSALEVRGRILEAFEAAELAPDERDSWLTFVIVGGGPTGVEMAGQIAELAHDTLSGEFRRIDPGSARVLLVETADRVLSAFRDPLPRKAAHSLEQLGVELMVSHTVVDVQAEHVELQTGDGTRSQIATRTVIWAAGVMASSLGRMLGDAFGAEVDKAGRVLVEPDLTLPGHPEALALGDMVRVRDQRTHEAQMLPGLAPVAIQEGHYAGRLIAARLAGRPSPRPFHYRDKGTLATIGRAKAVADVAGLRFNGFLAWLTWAAVHIYYLVGFENREIVLIRWAISYVTRSRGNRLITGAARTPPS